MATTNPILKKVMATPTINFGFEGLSRNFDMTGMLQLRHGVT